MSSEKILIVDDEESVLKLLERRLSSEGYHVIKAETGREAVNKTKTFMPHLIIMDIILPDINGAEAVQLIKSDAQTREIPVLFLSGIIQQDPEEKPTVKVGEESYEAVSKPIDFDELLSEIRKRL